MILTDPAGQPLSDEDLAFLFAHPRIARLAVKACKMQGEPPEIQTLNLLAWALRLLPAPPPSQSSFQSLSQSLSPPAKGNSAMGFDLLGQLLGVARRRRLEQQARQDAQALLDASKQQLVSLAVSAINGLPLGTAASQFHQVAGSLLTQALASPTVQSLVPVAAQSALGTAISQALNGVPLPDLTQPGALNRFQIAARVAVAQAIRDLTL